MRNLIIVYSVTSIIKPHSGIYDANKRVHAHAVNAHEKVVGSYPYIFTITAISESVLLSYRVPQEFLWYSGSTFKVHMHSLLCNQSYIIRHLKHNYRNTSQCTTYSRLVSKWQKYAANIALLEHSFNIYLNTDDKQCPLL